MSAIHDGGPALPQSAFINQNGEVVTPSSYFVNASGLSLRDWFAGQAMEGYLAGRNGIGRTPEEFEKQNTAAACYRYADAMLAARESETEPNGKEQP